MTGGALRSLFMSKKQSAARSLHTRFDVEQQVLSIPKRTQNAFRSIEDVKRAFALPVTLGTKAENRRELDLAFDSIGGYDAIYGSLTQHASDLGQYPVTSFIGYGALQQIAQNGMIRACVQTVADDITREWIQVTGGDDSDPEVISELQDLQESKYHLRKLFNSASATTGYMGGAFVFIDTGKDEVQHLPLIVDDISAELIKGTRLRFIVVDPINVTPGEYNTSNPLREDYMQPKWWWVLGKKVHASRLIPIIDNPPPLLLRPSYNFLGIPQAQILWDYVLHWNECRVSTANLLKKISLLVVKTDTNAIFGQADGVRLFDQRMAALQRYRDNDSVYVCDKEEEDVTNIQTSIAGCTDIVRQALEMIAAINRTPAVKLLGISPSGFNATGESDITNYNDYIASKQSLRRDAIMTCLRAIQLVEFGRIDDSIGFDFNTLNRGAAAEEAAAVKTRIDSLAVLADRQAISPEELRTAVKNDPTIGLDFLSDEMPDLAPQDFMSDVFDEPDVSSGNEHPVGRNDADPVSEPNEAENV